MKFAEPRKILDAATLKADLTRLLGYVWAEGNQKREMPSKHFLDLVDYFLKKYKLR